MTNELREKITNLSIDGLKKVHEKHKSVSVAQVGIPKKTILTLCYSCEREVIQFETGLDSQD